MNDVSSEPTMEEILSSIKKIIAEDGDKSLSTSRPRRALSREPSHDEFGSVRLAQPTPAPAVDRFADDNDDDDILELTEMATEDQTINSSAAPVAAPAVTPEIVSPVAVAATRSAFDALSSLIVKPDIAGADTLEGMVRDMLRPMLKDWLDTRLPEIVESLVAKEIARISGR